MTFKDKMKAMRRALARYAIFTTAWILERLPPKVVERISAVLCRAASVLLGRHRRIARESLDIAFGDSKSEAEKQRIIYDCFDSIGRNIIEMIYLGGHLEEVKDRVTVEGMEHLEAALGEGRGVIAMTAHLGNFPLMMMYFAQSGYQTYVMQRVMRDATINAYLHMRREQINLKTIYTTPPLVCVQNSLRALRNNGLIFMLMDQNFGSEGRVFVDFFGRKAATATGPIVFARRAKAPILPVFIHRMEGNKHRIVIEHPFELTGDPDDEKMMVADVARMTRLIEDYVRRFPQEWGWMHRRWKSRPRRGQSSKKGERDVSEEEISKDG